MDPVVGIQWMHLVFPVSWTSFWGQPYLSRVLAKGRLSDDVYGSLRTMATMSRRKQRAAVNPDGLPAHKEKAPASWRVPNVLIH